MADVLVVGSGATGVHAAQTFLEHGLSVELVDVGYERPTPPLPDASFAALKEALDDPEGYFLGRAGEAVVYPSRAARPYGFPPSKAYVFRRPAAIDVREAGFHPLLSFARGGLAEAWTGGSYELRAEELADFPFDSEMLRRHYTTVAARIGVTGERDDLERLSPMTAAYHAPIPPDAFTAALQARYAATRSRLNAGGFVLGRSRVAVLTRDMDGRRACGELGRCLWGCPRGSLYTPSLTLGALLAHPRFTYRPGAVVRRVLLGARGEAQGVVAAVGDGHGETEIRGDRVVLAAGALATTQIYLQTWAARGEEVQLPGLMDNRHVMIPFIDPRRVGAPVRLASYQYHMLALGIAGAGVEGAGEGEGEGGDAWRREVHGQITTLKAAAIHPIVSTLPFDLAASLRVFRRIRGALGVANIWLSDHRRAVNLARLERAGDGAHRLVLEYGDDSSDLPATDRAIAATRRALRALGCLAPRAMVRVLPRGSSVHYAGTLPMTAADDPHTCRGDGSVRGIAGLYVVDGAAFPWLPARNLTFTLMANAVRIATQIAGEGARGSSPSRSSS